MSNASPSNFAVQHGWSFVETVAEDGSARRYDRIEKAGKSAILMNVYGHTPGHRLDDFVRIGAWLREIGLSAPKIYEQDEQHLILEDFGNASFKDKENYPLSGQVLEHLDAQDCPLSLPKYHDSHVHKARDLIMRWYVPALRGTDICDELTSEYLAVWNDIEASLNECPQGFLHIDFHAENLMWLPERDGLRRCGILDFQGAMIGPSPYDLVNLLEDMRCDVPKDVRQQLLRAKSEDYLSWYRVLGTQFHCRLIGQCVRWAVRDRKPGYLQYLPRLFMYLNDGLKYPILRPLKQFFDDQGLSFDNVPELDLRVLSKG